MSSFFFSPIMARKLFRYYFLLCKEIVMSSREFLFFKNWILLFGRVCYWSQEAKYYWKLSSLSRHFSFNFFLFGLFFFFLRIVLLQSGLLLHIGHCPCVYFKQFNPFFPNFLIIRHTNAWAILCTYIHTQIHSV